MKKRFLKLFTYIGILAIFITGCGNNNSNNNNTLSENTENNQSAENDSDTTDSAIDINAMEYDFIFKNEKEVPVAGIYYPDGWCPLKDEMNNDQIISLQNNMGAAYTVAYIPQNMLGESTEEDFIQSIIETYESSGSDIVMKYDCKETCIYGDIYLFISQTEVTDSNGSHNWQNYEGYISLGEDGMLYLYCNTYSEKGCSKDEFMDFAKLLFETKGSEKVAVPEGFEHYLTDINGDNSLGYNIPENYSISESTFNDSVGLSSSSGDFITLSVCHDKYMEVLYTDGPQALQKNNEDIFENCYYSNVTAKELEIVNTLYGDVKIYDTVSSVTYEDNENENNTYDMRIVIGIFKFNGQFYYISYSNYNDAFFQNTDINQGEYDGSLNNLILQMLSK